jgi:hypothetical protein
MHKQPAQITSLFGVSVIVDPECPANTAYLQERDGRLVYIVGQPMTPEFVQRNEDVLRGLLRGMKIYGR